jgi:hypothetical protein
MKNLTKILLAAGMIGLAPACSNKDNLETAKKEIKEHVKEYWGEREFPEKERYQKDSSGVERHLTRKMGDFVFGGKLSKNLDTAYITGSYSYSSKDYRYFLVYEFGERYVKEDGKWRFDSMTKNERNKEAEKLLNGL